MLWLQPPFACFFFALLFLWAPLSSRLNWKGSHLPCFPLQTVPPVLLSGPQSQTPPPTTIICSRASVPLKTLVRETRWVGLHMCGNFKLLSFTKLPSVHCTSNTAGSTTIPKHCIQRTQQYKWHPFKLSLCSPEDVCYRETRWHFLINVYAKLTALWQFPLHFKPLDGACASRTWWSFPRRS